MIAGHTMAEHFLSNLFSSADTRWAATVIGVAAALIVAFQFVRRRPKPGKCAECQHDLRGIAGDRCPECGLGVAATTARIAARARARRGWIVAGVALALAAGLVYLFTESVTTWIKWAAAASMTDRELAAQSMRFDGSDARMALKDRGDAIAAGERTVDGSLSDPAAIRAVINQPMKHRIAPIAPTGKPDPHTMQELDGRLAALLSIPRVFINRAYIARELLLNDGRPSGEQTIEEEQLLRSLLSDPQVIAVVADAEVVNALLGWAARPLVRRDGTATDWVLTVERTSSLVGLRALGDIRVISAKMRCAGVDDVEVDVLMQPHPRALLPSLMLLVPEGVCDEGEFVIDFEITRVAVPGATDPPSTFTMQSRVPFGPDSKPQRPR
jgi:hypothetical protein